MVPERLTSHQFHGDKGRIFLEVQLVDRGDVRVVQTGGRLRLFPQPRPRVAIDRRTLGKEFQRDLAMQDEVLGAIYRPHSAFSELSHNTVMRNGLSDHKGRNQY